jgi:hypothetical protein
MRSQSAGCEGDWATQLWQCHQHMRCCAHAPAQPANTHLANARASNESICSLFLVLCTHCQRNREDASMEDRGKRQHIRKLFTGSVFMPVVFMHLTLQAGQNGAQKLLCNSTSAKQAECHTQCVTSVRASC